MSFPAPFTTSRDFRVMYPVSTSNDRSIESAKVAASQIYNKIYMCDGHVYSNCCTIPKEYWFWFSPPPQKSITVLGESKSQILNQFESAVLQSNLSVASMKGVELHCSGYFHELFNILIKIVGTHIHIHNTNIATKLLERYHRFENYLHIPKNAGTVHFPENENFYNKPEVLAFRKTINCQPVRNYVIEIITIITLSHQKEMTIPVVNSKDLNHKHLFDVSYSLKIGGNQKFKNNLIKMIRKNEFSVVLKIIEKFLMIKIPKVQNIIYWIIWLQKFELKVKRKGEKIPVKSLSIPGLDKKDCKHWVWYIWKLVIARVGKLATFKIKQIVDIYALFKINFKLKLLKERIHLLFYAINLLEYDLTNNITPNVLFSNIHLHIQAYSNINSLYKNLQIRLGRKSWVKVLGEEKTANIRSTLSSGRISKKKVKEFIEKKKVFGLNQKTKYLDFIPSKNY